jgi:DNA-binding XRE family transcriptional regulator
MADVVVYSNAQDLAQAGQFARDCLQNAELRTFDNIVQDLPFQSVLVYLTHPDDDHIPSLLRTLRPSAANVVIYCADHNPAPEQVALLGRLVGEVRPRRTELVFRPQAAIDALYVPHHGRKTASSESRVSVTRERLGLTQTEMGQALGVSLRTIQNWERQCNPRGGHLLRDLEELLAVLSALIPASEIPKWLRAESHSLGGKRPVDLVLDGRTRDIINEFQRLQAGEPV